MTKTPTQWPLEVTPERDQRIVRHGRDWLAHVQAGRIGQPPSQTNEQRLRHVRNELAVLGRIV
ncbi:hypothetical protein [Aurantiacibacter poecillastricola]|uniref:hypothetical protein n=1 Tax=Aurantiacibacter poecillastricola TaxID=3064385 RepID=UPI00273E4850|nr:hypothetical protein [Aurantiacibacter sp. 219JJ12-13]MDP5261662.1 hypothetical protein [Aurantiacibacter sp. 219JJ12-13]